LLKSRAAFVTLAGLALALLAPAAFAAPAAVDNLNVLVDKKAASLELMHRKARKALVTSAQDQTFRNYFSATTPAARAAFKQKIEKIALNVQSRFQVDEMCFIDHSGAEIARIQGGAVAQNLDLNESDKPFFAPTFALPERRVHISPAYLSEDARKWVLAYVTPVALGGKNTAILHYEHDLARYQAVLTKGWSGEDRFIAAVDRTGWVLADSRRAIPLHRRAGEADAAAYFKKFDLHGLGIGDVRRRLGSKDSGSGTLTLGGRTYALAYRTVQDWTVIAVERRSQAAQVKE
jgi:hypothetical protein